MFVVDAGEGGARNISLMGLPNPRIRALFLTHYHSDHIDGLGPMMLMRWVASGNSSPLPVHGPEGVEAVIAGFNAAYAADNGYRTAHHGATVTPPQAARSEEHTSELQSLMRNSTAVFCLKKQTHK